LSINGVRRLIPVSLSLAKHLVAQGFSEKMLKVAPNGVPTPGPLAERPVPEKPWTIGMIALYRPRKGVEVLMEAVSRLQRKHPLRLLLVGPFETMEYERTIHGMAETLGIDGLVEWTGFTREVNLQLSRMDLFVLPSLYGEGMPMVVLEAMACGVPVIGTRVEGIPEVIENGQSGMLVAPDSADELAAAIEKIMCGGVSWQSLRERAYKRQVETFSDYSMTKAVAEVYRGVLMQ
jgi:glycosyltransferase involved in cell wall biosynthesis